MSSLARPAVAFLIALAGFTGAVFPVGGLDDGVDGRPADPERATISASARPAPCSATILALPSAVVLADRPNTLPSAEGC